VPASTSGFTPDRDRRLQAERHRGLREEREFRLALDVEAVDPGLERRLHLGAGLADAGEHDLARIHPGGQRPVQLAARDDVHPGAPRRERAQHGLVRVRLHGEADERIVSRERLREHAVVPLQGGGAVAVERRADLGGEGCQVDILGVQAPVAVVEMVHLGRVSSARRSGGCFP
jgi:hypothetical protein